MTTQSLVSNVKFSADHYDPTIGGLTAILIHKNKIWVTSSLKGLVVVYKRNGSQVKSYSVMGASGLAPWNGGVLVSSSSGTLYHISKGCDNGVQTKLQGQGSLGGIATVKNKHIYAVNTSDNSITVYDKNFVPIHRYTDSSLTSMGYNPVNVSANGKDIYMVYNNRTTAVGSVYINVLEGKCIKRLVNRGNLSQSYGLVRVRDELLVGSGPTGVISTYSMDGNTATYRNNISNAEGGPLTYGGISGMCHCEETNCLYLAINAEAGKIGGIEVIQM